MASSKQPSRPRWVLTVLAVLVPAAMVFVHERMSSVVSFEKSKSSGKVFAVEWRHDLCVLYDKPPRTGSTTISSALLQCWNKKGKKKKEKEATGNEIHVVPYTAVNRVVSGIVNASPKERRVGYVGRHFEISQGDLNLLRANCRETFLVTSSREMRGRLWSRAKFSSGPYTWRQNATVSTDSLPQVWDALWDDMKEEKTEKKSMRTSAEEMLEKYPFAGAKDLLESRRLLWNGLPDYVVRHESLQEDLGLLLEAFGCARDFSSTNVHEDVGGLPTNLSRLPLRHGDWRHISLGLIAHRGNPEGLEKARRILSPSAAR